MPQKGFRLYVYILSILGEFLYNDRIKASHFEAVGGNKIKMTMTNDAVLAINTPPLPVDQQILLAIKKRYDLNPKQKELIFEVGGLGITLNTANGYFGIVSALDGLKEKAGFNYVIEDTYTDGRGRIQHYTLYESRLCKIEIKDREKFENYCKEELSEGVAGDSIQVETGKPYCVVENGWGYLKFGKFGKKKRIGKPKSRPFRLLQCLLEPLRTGRTVDSVFEAIRLPKDKDDSRLSGWNTERTRKTEIIKNTIKELQKGNKLEGKIGFEFDEANTQVMAQLTG